MTNSTGLKHREIDDDHLVWARNQEMRAGCAFCGWSFTGTAAEGIAASALHRKQEHPLAVRARKRPKPAVIPMAPIIDPVTQAEGAARGAEVAEMLRRRGLVEGEAGAPVAAHGEPPVSSSTSPRRVKREIVENPGARWHGTTGGYTNHWCRCSRCRAAMSEYNAAARERRKLPQAAVLTESAA